MARAAQIVSLDGERAIRGERSARREVFPSGHSASIHLFTGVQIVREAGADTGLVGHEDG